MNWINFAGKNLAQSLKQLRNRIQRIRSEKQGKQNGLSPKQTTLNEAKPKASSQKKASQKIENLNDNVKFLVVEQGKNLQKMGVKKGVEATQPSKPSAVPDARPNADYEFKGMQKSRGRERGKGVDL